LLCSSSAFDEERNVNASGVASQKFGDWKKIWRGKIFEYSRATVFRLGYLKAQNNHVCQTFVVAMAPKPPLCTPAVHV